MLQKIRGRRTVVHPLTTARPILVFYTTSYLVVPELSSKVSFVGAATNVWYYCLEKLLSQLTGVNTIGELSYILSALWTELLSIGTYNLSRHNVRNL